MANGEGWTFVKNWGWALMLLIAIAGYIATIIGHSDDKDIHMSLQEKDTRYVPREIFNLRMKGFEKEQALIRMIMEKIDTKLDNLQ